MRVLVFVAAMLALALPGAARAQNAGYDLNSLTPEVREAVTTAREHAAQALAAAETARAAAARADEASEHARNGEAGYYVENAPTYRFEGAGADNIANGPGVLTFTGSEFQGDRYRGDNVDNHYVGFGVYEWADNENNHSQQLKFEGQFDRDAANGVGVRTYRDGETRAGDVVDFFTTGYVVQTMASGARYEGQMSGGQWSGYGVIWTADGQVDRAGRWEKNELMGN